ncbi:alpha-tocopherol transfer protein-like isoform X1 [Rhipicephalus microplus]|uniref:alpha-tocopherol transfer protein-like isoform X1 n=1 Tax=Rhipicephalus microplus TaxID=6941 RepID=UPI003F6AFF44
MSGIYTKKCVDDVWDSSEGALPYKLQRIAEEELGETSAKRKESLERLSELLEAEMEVNSQRDPAFLLRFLRVRKYDVESSLRTIRNYYRSRVISASSYQELLPSKVPPAARNLVMTLPDTDRHGRLILLCRPGIWVPQELPYADFHRACLLCLEQMALNPVAQTSGIVLLVDYAEFTADKILSVNVGLVRKALGYVQDGMPMRLKAVHIVRQSYAFDMVFALFKPFIKAKMAERYRFHGENFEKLHEEIPPSALPVEYAGQGPPLDFEAYWRTLDQQEEFLAHENSFGYASENKDDMLAECDTPRDFNTF